MDKHTNRTSLDKGGHAEAKKPFPAFLKYGIIALAAVVVIAVTAIIWFSIQNSYVATVDGAKIGVGEFKYYLESQKTSMLEQAKNADPNTKEDTFWKTNIGGENAFEVAKKKTLDSLQELKIQLIKARESGVKLDANDNSYIDQQINSIIKNYETRIKANNALKSQSGLTLDDFTKMYQDAMLMQKFMRSEMDKMKVDVKTYLEKQPDWYKESEYRTKGDEAVWARHILVNVASGATQADKDAAKKKAEDLLARAKAGEDFAKLAKENSDDTGSKDYGGEYVFGKNASFIQEFKDTAFALNPGDISGLVQTQYGYHIIKVEEKYAKDEPVSLKCATDYHEYGTNFIKYKLYKEKLESWKKDPKYAVEKNQPVYNSIKSK